MEKYMNDIKFIIFESRNKRDIDKLLEIDVNKYKNKNIITYIILLVLILLIIYILIKYV
jgi:t-SNARE complex subunit (syntaxin)